VIGYLGPGSHEEAALATTRIGPDIVSKQQALTGFDVTPDGETIVFARREVVAGAYISHLWRVPTAGGRPERLTTAKPVDRAPCVAPDGSSVLFVSERDGAKKSQAWVLPLAGGEPRKLCELKDGVSSGVWSPDGRTVALTAASGVERYLIGERADDKDPTGRVIRDVLWRFDGIGVLDQNDAVWTVAASGGSPVRRTSPDHGAGGVVWSPDGTRLAFVGDRRPEASIALNPQVWSIAAEGGKPSRVSPEGHVVIDAAWGRRGIVWRAYHARVPAWQTIGAWVRRGRDIVQLAPGRDLYVGTVGFSELTADAEGSSLEWFDDDHVVTIASERGISLPWRLGLDGSAECLAPDVTAGCVTLRVADGRVFVVASVDGDVGELHEVEDGDLRRIPRGTGRWFAPYRQEAERITVKRRELPDVDGWLVRARTGRGPRPLVVRPHRRPVRCVRSGLTVRGSRARGARLPRAPAEPARFGELWRGVREGVARRVGRSRQ
jgi:dipeptidyl aminopeptidase/acylaminoacyl peptidase